MPRVSKDELLKFLGVFDLELKRKITIVAFDIFNQNLKYILQNFF